MDSTTTRPTRSATPSAPSLRDVPTRKLLATLNRLPWRRLARPEQLPPPGEWRVWYVRGGRGSGKTRTGSQALAEWILAYPGLDWAVVAPTFGDARDVCIEGPSGLLHALGLPRTFDGWNRSYGELFLPGGGVVYCDGADDGALRIQGKNLAGLWADEVGLWRNWRTAWEESIAFAVRIDPARIVATGTPKRGHPLVRKLLHDERIPTTRLRTFDNAANLSRTALDELVRRYGGTDLGRQELEGEELEEVEGAQVRRDMIVYRPLTQVYDKQRNLVDHWTRGAVAIDPAVTSGPDSDETGIVAAVVDPSGDGYVVEDRSGRYSPLGWSKEAIAVARNLGIDTIVAEVNNGGDLVEAQIRNAGWTGRIIKVHASRGKTARAEPVGAGYERVVDPASTGFRIYHVRPFPELEDQWCTFTRETADSPDRLDAEVWAMTYLLVERSAPGPADDFSMVA